MNELQDNEFAQKDSILRLGRIADIIFALAMAQCFFAIDFPHDISHPKDTEVIEFLLSQAKPLTSYAIAFVIIGYYWLDNIKQFRYFRKVDDIHISLYLLYLMSMFLIPYTDALVIYFPENMIVKICLSANTALIGLVSFMSWNYATRHRRLVYSDLSDKDILLVQRRILIEPIFSLITIVAALINQTLWDYIWFLLPIPYVLIEMIYKEDNNSILDSDSTTSNNIFLEKATENVSEEKEKVT
jgi:uncharacterized membrane protein